MNTDEQERLRLQDRFLRGFSWLRKVAGMTQRDVAEAAGWKQPYVARIEDASSPLIAGLARIERYARACGSTGVMVFVDKESGKVLRTLALGDDGIEAAERLRLARPAARRLPTNIALDEPVLYEGVKAERR